MQRLSVRVRVSGLDERAGERVEERVQSHIYGAVAGEYRWGTWGRGGGQPRPQRRPRHEPRRGRPPHDRGSIFSMRQKPSMHTCDIAEGEKNDAAHTKNGQKTTQKHRAERIWLLCTNFSALTLKKQKKYFLCRHFRVGFQKTKKRATLIETGEASLLHTQG